MKNEVKEIKKENIIYSWVHVDDSKRCRHTNEEKVIEDSLKNSKDHFDHFLSMDIYGKGIQSLLDRIGEDEFENILDICPIGEHNINRYGCSADTLTELIDQMPVYAALKVTLTVADDGLNNEYYFLLVKEAEESSAQAHIFRLAKFMVGGVEV